MPISKSHQRPLVTVIGGAGFIGTSFCRRLADHQIPFEIVDIKVSGQFANKTVIADIRDARQLRDSISGDIIVHLAAVHRDDVADHNEYHSTNVVGTENVCIVAAEKKINRIIFTSSVAVYGFAPVGTDESGAISPFNEYGTTKYQAEGVLNHWLEGDPNNELVIVRPTVVFGPGNRGNVYNLFAQIASGRFVMIGPGKNQKSMAYVENVAAFLQHLLTGGPRRTIVNYVDDPALDMNGLVSLVRGRLFGKHGVGVRLPRWLGLVVGYLSDLVAKMTGKKLPVSAIRVRKFCSDSGFSSAKTSINGFIAPYTLDDGIIRTLESEFISPDPCREIFFTE